MGVLPKPESRAGFLAGLGVILLLSALWITVANESAAAHWHKAMSGPQGGVMVLGEGGLPDIDQQGRKVLVSGTPEVVRPARDPDFAVQAEAPLLERRVEMFQWQELHLQGHVTYQMDWVDHPVDWTRFEQPRRHHNPRSFPFASKSFVAGQVRLGHYVLGTEIVRALPGVMMPVMPDLQQLPANLQASFRAQDGYLTTSAKPHQPRLGDLRVQWMAKPLQEVTVIAKVRGNQLVAGPATSHGQGFQVWLGKQKLTDVFANLPLPPPGMWAWRIVALILTLVGAALMFQVWTRPVRRGVQLEGAAVGVLLVVGGLAWLVKWVF